MPNRQPQPAAATQPDQLAGLVERVTFHNDESGFCVLRVKARGHRELVTVVGTLPEVRAGEWLEAQGAWTINKEFGQQFRAEILRTMPPTTVEGIEKYLASGMIKGIGPVLAGRIVKVYKERTFEIIDAEPKSLTNVEGIGPTRKEKITEAWQEQKAIREIMVFLHGHKVSTSRACQQANPPAGDAAGAAASGRRRRFHSDTVECRFGCGESFMTNCGRTVRIEQMQELHDCPDQRAEVIISRRAHPVHPVVTRIAENLSGIEILRIVKVTPGFLSASSETSGARKCPVTGVHLGHPVRPPPTV